MSDIEEGDLLWEPSADVQANANITHYMNWLRDHRGLHFDSFRQLWQWSVDDVAPFWRSIWDYFDIFASSSPEAILPKREMPGARWFPGAQLNYAENIFARMQTAGPVILFQEESGRSVSLERKDLYDQTAALAHTLRRLGVRRGDRVVAYLPNIPEAIVGLLASASLGAIWSSSSPDFGARSVLDRFSQIEPAVLLAVDGYRYNGKWYDRLDVVRELQLSLPTLEQTILVSDDGVPSQMPKTMLWKSEVEPTTLTPSLTFDQLPFDHPLWVLYSSGTTGLPKPIVHGHGGIILEHLKELTLHMDLKPDDRFFWYTSTGWMMWNYLVGGLLTGSAIVVYDGSPNYPDLNSLWQVAADLDITYFGASAAFIHACMQAGTRPNDQYNLQQIRAVGSTGSPLSPAGFQWVYENVNDDLALESFSGGTDLCTGFLGGVRTRPVHAGKIQHPSLGAKVQALNESGQPISSEVGELVIAEPMPSMPLYFWNDEGDERYRASYFEMYPGIWRHGDWIQIDEDGSCVIYGRSDATINRQGIRMGTSEIYRAVQSLPEIEDSLVVDLEGLEGESYMPLFVVLAPGETLDDDLKERIRQKLREDISPRHLPDEIASVDEVPYTLSGKKMELPVRRILQGESVAEAANPGAMRNPDSLDFFQRFADTRKQDDAG